MIRAITFWGALLSLATSLTADTIDVATSTGAFGTYNTLTNTFTSLGVSSEVLYGLAFDNGILYANSPATGSLYAVDTGDGVLTPVGLLGNSSGTGALASAPGGGPCSSLMAQTGLTETSTPWTL
jgi:hypothetical protein